MLWAAVVAVAIQFFINMEVERYTLATGETAITGFTRLWRPWWFLFVIMAVVPNVWPGLATGAATCLSFVIGGLDVTLVAVLGLLAIGVTLDRLAGRLPDRGEAPDRDRRRRRRVAGPRRRAGHDHRRVGRLRQRLRLASASIPFGENEAVTAAVIAGAIAFAGSGGCGNLAVSNWVRDKGMGMGHDIPHIVSPLTGEKEAVPSTGNAFPPTPENLARWNRWWKVANAEQAVTFWLIGTAGIVVLSVLAYSTLFGQETGEDFDFIQKEGEVLKEVVAPWFGTVFWMAGFFKLLSTTLGNFDYVSRISADAVKINAVPDSRRWTESRIYAATVWLLVVVGIVILLTVTEQPLLLIVISSALSAGVMFIYSILLIVLNRKALPAVIRISGYRLAILGFAVLWFGYFSARVIIEYGGQL